MKPVSTLLLIAFVFCACSEPQAASELNIVGGEVVAEASPLVSHTVALVETQGELEQFCTGVIIAPNVILTAAHCLAETRKRGALFFGTAIPKSRKAKDERFVDIKKVVQHPDFSMKKVDAYDKKLFRLKDASKALSPGFKIDDLALVSFEGTLPASYSPVAIAHDTENIVSVTAAGFGCIDTDCEKYANRLRSLPMSWVKTLADANLVVMYAGKNKGTCAGDSGGPDYIEKDGALEVLSIVYSGPERCEAGISVDTLLSPYREWIEATVLMLAE